MNLPRDEQNYCSDDDDFDSDKLDLSLAARYEPLRDAYFNPFYDEVPPNDGLGPNVAAAAAADSKLLQPAVPPKQRQKLANHLCSPKSRALSRSQSQSQMIQKSQHRSLNHDGGRGDRDRSRGRRTESMRHMNIKTTPGSRSNSTQTLLAQNTGRDVVVATNRHQHANHSHEDSNRNAPPSTPLSTSLAGLPTELPSPSPLPSPTTTATNICDDHECKGLLDLGSAISSALVTDDDDDQDHGDGGDDDEYHHVLPTTTDTLTNVCDDVENMNIHPTDDTAIRSPPIPTSSRTRKEWFDLVDMNQVTPEMRRRLLRRNGRTRNTYCLQSIFDATKSSSSSPRDRHGYDESILPSWWDLPDVTPCQSSMQSQASTTTTNTTAVTKPAFPSSFIVKQQRQEPHDQHLDDQHQQQEQRVQQQQQQPQQHDQQPPVPKANDTHHVYRIRVSARQLEPPQHQQQQEQEQQPPLPVVPKPGETLVYRIRVTARKLNPDEVVAWADSPTFQKPKLYTDKGSGKGQTNSESKTTQSKSKDTFPPLPPTAFYRQPSPSRTMRDDQHYSRQGSSSRNKSTTQVEERESTPRRSGAMRRRTHGAPSA